MDKKQNITKIWTKATGKKVPLPMMDNEYLKNAYRRCAEIVLGNVSLITEHGRSMSVEQTPLTKDQANAWKNIFETEAKNRGIKLPKIEKDTYSYNFGARLVRKRFRQEKNKQFDEKFK